ncbi:hypothetical protein ANCCAN_00019 [Ancylostoma caninum]|uniref:Inward rectifier potassium channel C-terminal domain-containing protein n=1 Tax=Ancylostoma caninum TaxID=29170 RepID=A0A368HAG2_ANCCA|nr:hypothetical protein ANCCAN_00019 [Ancylostoma caninum]
MRNTHLVEAHVRLQFISDRETAEGEIEPLHQFEMKVGPTITDDDRLFLVSSMQSKMFSGVPRKFRHLKTSLFFISFNFS